MVVVALLALRHYATSSWPLSGGQPGVLVAVGLLLLVAQGFKAWGWGRLFAAGERPCPVALAAGNGGAALVGVVLPGRFDDAMRVAVVRRYPGCPAGVRTLCLSLVMLGLIDSVALAPLALAGALIPGVGIGVRTGLGVVAVGGVAAAALILALPRLAASRRALRFRFGRWLNPRTTSPRCVTEAWALVSACWVIRAVAFFLLLGTLGIGFSIPLALLVLCAGAAAAAVPIGPAGAATQVGAGAAALIATGVGGSQALAVTLAVGAFGVLTGAAIFLAAVLWRTVLSWRLSHGRSTSTDRTDRRRALS
jgi:lysylphosphatidylglycerol synthase-like protein